MPNRDFWTHQRVFLTGHSGFKGSWAAAWLSRLGANQTGYSLPPETTPNLHDVLQPIDNATSIFGNILDVASLSEAVRRADPTVAVHMAAQPLVRRSYREPASTFAANVMGTLNVLEALRSAPNLRAVLVITTDKVYSNDNGGRAFREDDPLGGHDPYSSSKVACEEVVSCYRQSYYADRGIRLATARAGNVVGGGDWSEDRVVPDIWRAMVVGETIELRNPNSTRPWQHVLDPISGYLRYLEVLASDDEEAIPHSLNFAPRGADTITVRELTESLGEAFGIGTAWHLAKGPQPVEMKLLSLDASLAEQTIGWQPQLTGREAIEWTAEWYLRFHRDCDPIATTLDQIERYEALLNM